MPRFSLVVGAFFAQSVLIAPSVLIALSSSALAQTRAALAVEDGCNGSLPPGSLRTPLADPPLILPDAQDVFAFEVEWTPTNSSWVAETTNAGFSGASYYRWNGPDHFSSSGNAVLTWKLEVRQAGRYGIVLHNRHDHPDSSLENDCWMRMNGSSWTKVYSNTNNNSRVWNWHTRFDPGHSDVDYDLVAGVNTLQISARSYGFMIDRLHVFPYGRAGMESLGVPLGVRGMQRPILGTSLRFLVGDPSNAAGLPASGIEAWLFAGSASSAPCGLPLAGFGTGGLPGEFLLATTPAPIAFRVGAYGGPANPASIALAIPASSSYAGLNLAFQGLLFGNPGGPLRTVLTERLDCRLGIE